MQRVGLFKSLLITSALSYIMGFLIINPLPNTNLTNTHIRFVIIFYGYSQFVIGFLSACALYKIQTNHTNNNNNTIAPPTTRVP